MGKKSTPAAPATPDYTGAAKQQGQDNLDAARIGAELVNTNQVTPYGSQTFTKDPNSDQWTSTVSLSPDQQKLYDMQTAGQLSLGQTSQGMLGRVGETYGKPMDLSGAPDRINSIGQSNYNAYTGNTEAPVSKIEGVGNGQEVRDALYRQSTSMLDPQYQQQEAAMRSRLLNSGVQEGTEAYDTAYKNYTQSRDSAYADARDRSILAGGQDQSRQLADAIAKGGFANSAAQQSFDNLYQQNSGNNLIQSQKFNDALAGGQFQNNARGQAVDEAAYLRSQPLNEYNALSTGSQVTQPNFRGTASASAPSAAPSFAGAQAQGNAAMDLYNAQMAQRNSNMSGMYGLLGTALNAYGAYGGATGGTGAASGLGKLLGGSGATAAAAQSTSQGSQYAGNALTVGQQAALNMSGAGGALADVGTNAFDSAVNSGYANANDAINAANPSYTSQFANGASGLLGAYSLYNGIQNRDPAQALSGGAGIASSLGSSMASGLGAGGAAFALAGIGNQLLGNNDPYAVDNSFSHDGEGGATSGNWTAQFSADKGFMSNTNGTKYKDGSGKTFDIPLLNGRTGNSPTMIYQYLQKQGAKLPAYDAWLAEYQGVLGKVTQG